MHIGLHVTTCHLVPLSLDTGFPDWDYSQFRVGKNISKSITLSTGSPQGCVLSPLLYTSLTHDCVPSHRKGVCRRRYTVIGLIHWNDESTYREEGNLFKSCSRNNNLVLNLDKTKEIVSTEAYSSLHQWMQPGKDREHQVQWGQLSFWICLS